MDFNYSINLSTQILSFLNVFKFKILTCLLKCIYSTKSKVLKKMKHRDIIVQNLTGFDLTLKRLGGPPTCGFFKNVSFRERERVKPWLFVTFNNIISQIFPENFIEIPEVVKKIWKFSWSMLTVFIDFADFLTYTCYKKT